MSYFIKFSSGASYVGIKPKQAEEAITAYPNPGTGVYRVQVPAGASMLRVYDLTGKLRKTQIVKPGEDCTLNISNYSNGMYVVKFDEGIESAIKIVKQ